MRIISGIYGSRKLEEPRTKAIRPTSDKVRGAIMNALESSTGIEGKYVLDGFSGTGALGLEALSRGAQHCMFIDQNRTSMELTQSNANLLKATESCDFALKDMTRLPERNETTAPRDLVFLDPPYNEDLIFDSLESLLNGRWLAPNSTIVVEEDKSYEPDFPDGFEITSEKIYGDTKVLYLTHKTGINKEE